MSHPKNKPGCDIGAAGTFMSRSQGMGSGLLRDETAEWAAMERAGEAIGREVQEDFKEIGGFPAGGRMLILAGKGHNGGDALLAARTILVGRPENVRVTVVLGFGARELRPLAGRALDRLKAEAPDRVALVSIDEALGAEVLYALCWTAFLAFNSARPWTRRSPRCWPGSMRTKASSFAPRWICPAGVGETNAPDDLPRRLHLCDRHREAPGAVRRA